MPISRLLKIASSDVSQFVVPCTEKDCSGETLIDLAKWPAPRENKYALDIHCSRCGKLIQPPATELLKILQEDLKKEPPLFYLLIPDAPCLKNSVRQRI